MAKPIKFDELSDSQDLQALFDSIAADPQAVSSPLADASGDSDDLQALFDSVVAQQAAPSPADVEMSEHSDATEIRCDTVFTRLGRMTRELHNSLRELGYDQILKDTVRGIPDARERLSYIAQMTEQAASRVLNAIEIAQPIQNAVHDQSTALATRWEKVFKRELSGNDFKVLATETHAFLCDLPVQSKATNEQLMAIMLAQDFQDLTGQVIKKVVDMAQVMETQLLQLLFEAMPVELRAEAPEGMMNGPVINARGRTDVVSSQSQVDELLESLGF
jgi:chemotaxis protein CheZ